MSGEKDPSSLPEAVFALCYAYRASIALGQSQLPFEALLDAFKKDMLKKGLADEEYLAACKQLEDAAKAIPGQEFAKPPSPTAELRRSRH